MDPLKEKSPAYHHFSPRRRTAFFWQHLEYLLPGYETSPSDEAVICHFALWFLRPIPFVIPALGPPSSRKNKQTELSAVAKQPEIPPTCSCSVMVCHRAPNLLSSFSFYVSSFSVCLLFLPRDLPLLIPPQIDFPLCHWERRRRTNNCLTTITVSKFIFGDSSKESIIDIPQGQLYLVRPLSPKGYSELIFKDAAASIRRTGQEFQYQLVIQRAYEEGEEELAEDDDGQGASDSLDKDEKAFLLDQNLHFRSEVREGGSKILAWRDLSGDLGDLFEFVCDTSVPSDKVATFELAAFQCQFERKHRQSAQRATAEELQEFSFQEERPIPSASPITSPTKTRTHSVASRDSAMVRDAEYTRSKKQLAAPAVTDEQTVAPPSAAQPEAREVLTKERAELHLFDFQTGTFVLQDSNVTATVTEVGDWKYWLQISGENKDWLGQAVVADINPVFNFEYLSFIFNHYDETGSAYSWLLRFTDQETEERFQQGLLQALWEQLNEVKWTKVKDNDKEYVLDAFQDLTMEDAEEAEKEEDEEEEEEEEEEDDTNDGQRSEHYDSDEEQDDVVTRDADGNVNSQLAVGYKHDRSFVVRGSKIGVFKHTPDNNLEFSTNISKVETPKGKLFSPKKVMLHAEDSNLILQNNDNPNSLYRMDLEYGKIVDEWKVHDDIPVETFAPESVSLSFFIIIYCCADTNLGRNSRK